MITNNEIKRLVDKIWRVEHGNPDVSFVEVQEAAKYQLRRKLTQEEVRRVLLKYYEKVDYEEEKKEKEHGLIH